MPYSPMELAEAFLKTGELDDALEALQEQLSQTPADDAARRLLIQIQMRLATNDTLAMILSEFDVLTHVTADDLQAKSVVLERLSNLEEAISTIEQARSLAPDNDRLTERLLDLLLATGAYEQALTLVREQTRSWRWLEREGDVLVLLGDNLLATARYGLVLAHLEQFEGQMRDDYLQALRVRVLLARAHAYRRLGHMDTAREHYQNAQAILGEDVTIRFNLGLLDYIDGDIDAAVARCQAALDAASDSLRAYMHDAVENDPTVSSLKRELQF